MRETLCFISRCFISLQYIRPTVSTYISTSSHSPIWRQDRPDCSDSFSEKKLLFSVRTFLCTLNLTQNPCFPSKITFISQVPGSPNSIATFFGKDSIFGLGPLSAAAIDEVGGGGLSGAVAHCWSSESTNLEGASAAVTVLLSYTGTDTGFFLTLLFGGGEEGLGLLRGFWALRLFWNTTGEGQHQNPSGVTAIGTFFILVWPCSILVSLIPAMSTNDSQHTHKANVEE